MRYFWLLLVSASLLLQSHSALQAAILYHQTFRHPDMSPATGTNVPLSSTTLGWSSYYGATAANITSNTSNSKNSTLIGWVNGAPSYEGPGYLYTRDSQTTLADRSYFITSEVFDYPFQMSQGPLTAQFYGNVSIEEIGVHFMIKVANQWYVSEDLELVVGTQANIGQSSELTRMLKTVELVSTPSAWRMLSLNPGVGYSLGASPTNQVFGDITQFGFYVTNPTGVGGADNLSARIDSLQISQVAAQIPEPRTMLLLLLGIGAFVLRRKPVA